MKKQRQTGLFWQLTKAILLFGATALILSGCAAESPNPLAVENLNGPPPKQELVTMDLDCRGVINGLYQPGGTEPYRPYMYPINYTGDWQLLHNQKSQWYMITTNDAGARIDVVATMSRVVFDFWNYEMYENPGRVTFLIDDKPLGTFDLNRAAPDGMPYLNYQITTQKNTVATISMILESGRVTLVGYLINFLDPNFPY
ncbi:MAG: hypothetical protein CVV41_21245 [Candidatus Riflebacteria bacterium HGW-Riflebacteria-1]|jgi:hypothetical protein|nr:MAG: hypothetical protein CVV41_21245 [Candidatus Riflebacteria bacterium HGW-Riflebacteria-1]